MKRQISLLALMAASLVSVPASAALVIKPGNNTTPQGLAAVQAAIDEISQFIRFDEEIVVKVDFNPMSCDPGNPEFAMGRPENSFANFTEGPVANDGISRIAIHVQDRRHIHIDADGPQLACNRSGRGIGEIRGVATAQHAAGRENREALRQP